MEAPNHSVSCNGVIRFLLHSRCIPRTISEQQHDWLGFMNASTDCRISGCRRLGLMLVAWVIALLATAIPRLLVVVAPVVFPVGLIWVLFPTCRSWPILNDPLNDPSASYLGWGFYMALSIILILQQKRRRFFAIYALLCVLLLLNVIGCHFMQESPSHNFR
jgi:hypothetical protein